ncbi:hypothetical protein [Rhodococcus ruber]|uniref:hypothetical protein n=1 Tax=Rhodococcus ruber TaxID=1830 RepID=UPI0012685CF9|nr:hypothetical protein [Rhodococcus ruber]
MKDNLISRVPKLGFSDFGYVEHPESEIDIEEWMSLTTRRLAAIERTLYGEPVKARVLLMSETQRRVYEYIDSRIKLGESTRLSDIRKEFGYASISSAQRIVDTLINKGYLRRSGHKLEVCL